MRNKNGIKKTLFIFVMCLTHSFCFAQTKNSIPLKNQCVIDTVLKYGQKISPTYQKAVCTELVIKIIEKFYVLDKTDKSRIRIITNQDIPTLLNNNSSITKGVYYALTTKGIGIPIDNLQEVLAGDFVQFWTDTQSWGHCGIVKSIDYETNTMLLYSSFPTTNGYGVQNFNIPQYCWFVRLK
ncbi:MAG: hypothetical protein FWC39_06695 [Bacteroidetes bacterium]|nr:hypothetical protein [Bacteroidota bacterium]